MTASQFLKWQRPAIPALQPLQQLQTDAAACQQRQHEQASTSPHCIRQGASGGEILVRTGEQEACDISDASLEGTEDPGPAEDSEQSCEDVLATWGEAGEPDQEFAWAEAPDGMGDGSTEGSSVRIGPDHAASMSGQRTWACQVCICLHPCLLKPSYRCPHIDCLTAVLTPESGVNLLLPGIKDGSFIWYGWGQCL